MLLTSLMALSTDVASLTLAKLIKTFIYSLFSYVVDSPLKFDFLMNNSHTYQ